MPSVLSFNQLPLDILFRIFHYLDIPDILRSRRVSRCLNEASRCRDVWADAYRKTDSVHPPGPFLSQSAHDLENALVCSFRVHRNFGRGGPGGATGKTTQRNITEILYTGVDLPGRVSLIFGRFLFIALREEVCCHDLNLDTNTESDASIVYRSMAGAVIVSFRCVSAVDVEGRPFACVVLGEATQAGNRTQISIYLVNIFEQSGVILDLLHQFEHSQFYDLSVALGPRVIVVSGNVGVSPDDDWRAVALDVHSRTQFLLPSFTFGGWEPDDVERQRMSPLMGISTSTHLLLARSLSDSWHSKTFLHAFTLPPSNMYERFTPLNHSHRGIISDMDMRGVVLLRDAILDASKQDILITVRAHEFKYPRSVTAISKYCTLRLGRGSHDEVGTIAFKFQPLGSLGLYSQTPFFRPSFNGIGRAFCTIRPGPHYIIEALEYDVRDNGDEKPVGKVIEYPLAVRFSTPRTLLDYDPYSGRICLQSTRAKYRVVEILELAV